MRKHLNVMADDFLFGYFGRLYPGKGLETLLRAFREVYHRRTNVRLLVIGGEGDQLFTKGRRYLSELQALASNLGIAERVTWTGEMPYDAPEMSRHLCAIDACVLPFEGGVRLNNSSLAAVAARRRPDNHDAGPNS